jgi:hypothetical protein
MLLYSLIRPPFPIYSSQEINRNRFEGGQTSASTHNNNSLTPPFPTQQYRNLLNHKPIRILHILENISAARLRQFAIIGGY